MLLTSSTASTPLNLLLSSFPASAFSHWFPRFPLPSLCSPFPLPDPERRSHVLLNFVFWLKTCAMWWNIQKLPSRRRFPSSGGGGLHIVAVCVEQCSHRGLMVKIWESKRSPIHPQWEAISATVLVWIVDISTGQMLNSHHLALIASTTICERKRKLGLHLEVFYSSCLCIVKGCRGTYTSTILHETI